MPYFDYRCKKCGHQYEELVQAGDPLPKCPVCGSKKVVRELSAPHVGNQFKKAWDRQPPSNPTKVYIRK